MKSIFNIPSCNKYIFSGSKKLWCQVPLLPLQNLAQNKTYSSCEKKSLKYATKYSPVAEQFILLAMLPDSAGIDPYASLILGNPPFALHRACGAMCLEADVQVPELYLSSVEKSILK